MSELPNPFTPLAFLPPSLAFDATFANYVAIGCLAVLIWDILNNLYNDYLLLFKHRIKWPTVAYFLSRISALAYVLGKSIALTAQIDDCKTMETVLCALFVASHSSTSLLLYLRICAVYDWKRHIVVIFSLTWLAATGGALTIFWGLEGIHIGPTRYCTSVIEHGFIQAVVWSEFVNDTLVFIAIMIKLSSLDPGAGNSRPTWRVGLAAQRTGMKRLTDAFMEDTQVYYLIAVVLNFATLITFFVLNNPPTSPFRIFMVFPATVVVNIMACRVFRNLKLRSNGFNSSSKDFNRGGGSRSAGEQGYYVGGIHNPTAGMMGPSALNAAHSLSFREDRRGTQSTGEVEVKVTELTEVHVDEVYMRA